MKFRLPWQSGPSAIIAQLNDLALSGDFDIERLHRIRQDLAGSEEQEANYYLASLYLHLNDTVSANEFLGGRSFASATMKRYFHVLSHCRSNGFAIPRLSVAENKCIDYLESTVNPADRSLEKAIVEHGGFTIAGNAPGDKFSHRIQGLRIYFNNYRSNSRITEHASVHVVTPSWDRYMSSDASMLCITSNDIFYRRSKVWRRFKAHRSFHTILTPPLELWRSLHRELCCSPSAGLLLLAWIEHIAARHSDKLNGCVAGYSEGRPKLNHSYDSVQASASHNWVVETEIRHRLIASLKHNCRTLYVES